MNNKSNYLSEELLLRFSIYVQKHMGLQIPVNRLQDIEKGITAIANQFNFTDNEECINWILSSPLTKSQIEVLASNLTVGETYFFRDREIFNILEEKILPELINSRRKTNKYLRIWSAGCCTGEEPYSIAILLRKIIPDIKNWNITILGTDINPVFLQKAKVGIYSKWSFRGLTKDIKEKCFTKTNDGKYILLPLIKNMVNFSYHNLAEDAYPSLLNNTNAMDIIFCRNVLMYFDLENTKKTVDNLYNSLIYKGWLIVSPTDLPCNSFSRFVSVCFSERTFYNKDSKLNNIKQQINFPVEKIIEKTAVSETIFPEKNFKKQKEKNLREYPDELLKKNKIQKETDLSEHVYKEAKVLFEKGDFVKAEEKIKVLLSKDEKDIKSIALLTQIYANLGKLKEACTLSEKSIILDKMNPNLYFLQANILYEQGKIDDAVKALKKTLYLDQNFVFAYLTLGNISQQQGKTDEAKKNFKNALNILQNYKPEYILPEGQGLSAGRLKEIILSITDKREL